MATSEFGSGFSHYGTVLVDELSDGARGYATGPERQLLSALLFDGIQNFMNFATAGSESTRTRYREAYHWITSKEHEYIFSFENCCEALGLSAQEVRLGLLNVLTQQDFHWKKARKKF